MYKCIVTGRQVTLQPKPTHEQVNPRMLRGGWCFSWPTVSVSISMELGPTQIHCHLRVTSIFDFSSLVSDFEISSHYSEEQLLSSRSYWLHFVFLLLAKSLIIYSIVCQAFLMPLFDLWCQILGFLLDTQKSSHFLLHRGYQLMFGLFIVG